MKTLAVFVSPVVAVFAILFAVVVVLAPMSSPPALSLSASSCVPQVADPSADISLDPQQLGVAQTVIAVGRDLDVPARGWVVALAAGLQESGLRPLRYGDRDSLGVFQQRAGWGSAGDRIDPSTAARMFFVGGHGGQHGLLDVADWTEVPLTEAAQAVQASGFPTAYAKWEPLATQLVKQLAHVDASCHPDGDWILPVGRARYVLTAGFGECGGLWAHCHTGQDFAVPTGTPVVASGDGIVVFAGWSGPYGNAVHVLHASGIETWYGHLSQIRILSGSTVSAGTLLGLSGATGNTTGPHLHFEVRIHASPKSSGTPIDPMPWLREQNVL